MKLATARTSTIEILESRIAPAAVVTMDLSGLTGDNGFKISGEAANDYSGRSVSGAGDINGDGIDDLIVGARGSDPNGNRSGASYVVFGSNTGFTANVNLSGLTGTNGFKISGESEYDYSGYSVSGAGDINGDGIDDLIVGARSAEGNAYASGASYVVFGSSTPFAANVNLSDLTGTNGFKISGESEYDNSGISVSGAGDINGDGIDDLIVGASYADANGNNSGASYVVFGIRNVTPTFSTDFKTATFTDVDGDLVTVKTTAGTFDTTNFRVFLEFGAVTGGGRFSMLDLSDEEFDGANITITAKRSVTLGGDGLVNLGFLDATGVDLGVFSLKGDLGRVKLGDGTGASATSFTVSSMGVYGMSTQWGASNSTVSHVTGELPLLTISGDVAGITLNASSLGTAKITGNVEGATFQIAGALTALTVNGDVLDTTLIIGEVGSIVPGATSGTYKVLGGIKINGDVEDSTLEVGGNVSTLSIDGTVRDCYLKSNGFGSIATGATTGSVKINGGISITGSLLNSYIRTNGDLAKLGVGRRLDGSTVSARGTDAPADDVAAQTIGAITVGGRVSHSSILAGYDTEGSAVNANVHIGKVKVGTHWIASNLVAGVTAGNDDKWGTTDDVVISGGNSIVSSIASLVITGHARGTVGGMDRFGIVAQKVTALSVSGTTIPLTAGASNNLTGFALGSTFDFRVREVAVAA